jgi:hypothetical protein
MYCILDICKKAIAIYFFVWHQLFFQSEEGMKQTNKTSTIKQDEFHRIFFVSICNCVNMQLPRPIQDGLDQFQGNVDWPTLILCKLTLT